jgi:hypothetical protein
LSEVTEEDCLTPGITFFTACCTCRFTGEFEVVFVGVSLLLVPLFEMLLFDGLVTVAFCCFWFIGVVLFPVNKLLLFADWFTTFDFGCDFGV